MTPVTARISILIPNPQSLITTWVRNAADAAISALLAPTCAVCDSFLDRPIDGCVCRNCWMSIRPITPPLCDRCGDPLARQDEICRACCGREHLVVKSRAIGEYEGVLREIIHSLKYERRHSLARPIAMLMRSRGAAVLENADYVVPVPLHWRREYQRGFNQAGEIARHLGLPVIDALLRRRHTRAQVELAADRRHANVANAFAVRQRRRSRLRGMRVVIVDDVSTTGATLESCAKALQQVGVSNICALTAARVVSRSRRA